MSRVPPLKLTIAQPKADRNSVSRWSGQSVSTGKHRDSRSWICHQISAEGFDHLRVDRITRWHSDSPGPVVVLDEMRPRLISARSAESGIFAVIGIRGDTRASRWRATQSSRDYSHRQALGKQLVDSICVYTTHLLPLLLWRRMVANRRETSAFGCLVTIVRAPVLALRGVWRPVRTSALHHRFRAMAVLVVRIVVIVAHRQVRRWFGRGRTWIITAVLRDEKCRGEHQVEKELYAHLRHMGLLAETTQPQPTHALVPSRLRR